MITVDCNTDEVQCLSGLLLEPELSKDWHKKHKLVTWSKPWFESVSTTISDLSRRGEVVDAISVGLAMSKSSADTIDDARVIACLAECFYAKEASELAMLRFLHKQ